MTGGRKKKEMGIWGKKWGHWGKWN
jgi:hypothetical protein